MTKNKDKHKNYVYFLLDSRKPGVFKYGNIELNYEPFYVGKGCGKRYLGHFNKHSWSYNKFKGRIINKIIKQTGKLPNIKIYNCKSEENAFINEIRYIKLIGRRNLNTGPLVNLTNGGDGVSGKIWSDEDRLRQSKNQIKRWNNASEEFRLNFSIIIKAAKRRDHEDFVDDVYKINPDIELLGKFISFTETLNIDVLLPCGCEKTYSTRHLVSTPVLPCYLHSLIDAAREQGLKVLDNPIKSRDYSRFKCIAEKHIFNRMSGKVLYKELIGCPACSRKYGRLLL